MTGQRLSLLQFRGKPVLVSLWATWNVGSIAQAATLGRFARAHADEVAVLGIDVEDSPTAARAFIRRNGMDFPSIADPIGKLGAAWAPVPTTLVLDRKHMVVQTIPSSVSQEQLDAALRRVIRP
jgi:thiol-disulfide isomerase/thioredoxin